MEKFAHIDQFCQAVITNNVANRASRTQGLIHYFLFYFILLLFYFYFYIYLCQELLCCQLQQMHSLGVDLTQQKDISQPSPLHPTPYPYTLPPTLTPYPLPYTLTSLTPYHLLYTYHLVLCFSDSI
jgi:hypothetical protein